MLDLCFQQLDIANDLESSPLRLQAYLSLARGNCGMGDSAKAESYCNHALLYKCEQSHDKDTGDVHLTLGKVTCLTLVKNSLNFTFFQWARFFINIQVRWIKQ